MRRVTASADLSCPSARQRPSHAPISIEDADILAFITQLHTVEDRNLPLFDPPNSGLIH